MCYNKRRALYLELFISYISGYYSAKKKKIHRCYGIQIFSTERLKQMSREDRKKGMKLKKMKFHEVRIFIRCVHYCTSDIK